MRNEMKRVRIIALMGVLILSLLLCSCSDEITEGEIYEKEFKPAETITTIIPMVISTGKTVVTQMIPVIRHYPDRYIIRIRKYNEEENTFLYNEYYVDIETYNKANIGDWFIYDEDFCLKDEPYTQEREETK